MKLDQKLLIILLLIIPFFRGLYFAHELFCFGAIICIMLCVCVFRHKKMIINLSIESLCIYTIIFLYSISPLFAVDKGMAVIGVLRFIAILLFYILIQQHTYYNNQYSKALSNTIKMIGIILSLISIISIFIPPLKNFIFQKNRMGSYIQYANTFCVLLLVSYILIVKKVKVKWYELIGLVSIFACILLSFSRSMNIITFIVVITTLIINRSRFKVITTTYFFGCGLGVLLSKMAMVNESIDRIQNISFGVGEWQSRLLYYIDSIQIIKENPFGLGYLGYYYVQKIYQSAIYHVKFIHSSILQIAIDIGILGAVIFVAIFIKFIITKKVDIHDKLIMLVMFLHSIIDIDMEFPIILIVICVIVVKYNSANIIVINRVFLYKAVICIMIPIYFYMALCTGYNYFGYADKAISMYPLYTEATITDMKINYKDNIEIAKSRAEEILNHNKNIKEAYIVLRNYYTKNYRYDEALYYAKRVMALDPLHIKYVEKYSEILLLSVKYAIMNNKVLQANKYIDKICELESYIDNQRQRVSERAYRLNRIPTLVMTKKLIDIKNEAMKLSQSNVVYKE